MLASRIGTSPLNLSLTNYNSMYFSHGSSIKWTLVMTSKCSAWILIEPWTGGIEGTLKDILEQLGKCLHGLYIRSCYWINVYFFSMKIVLGLCKRVSLWVGDKCWSIQEWSVCCDICNLLPNGSERKYTYIETKQMWKISTPVESGEIAFGCLLYYSVNFSVDLKFFKIKRYMRWC